MKRIALLSVLAVILAVPLVQWITTLSPDSPWELQLYALGRVMALMAFTLILCQFILSSKIGFLERGFGLDRQISVHRRFGQIGLVLLLLHPILLYSFTASQGFTDPSSALEALGLIDRSFTGPLSYGAAFNSYIILFGFLLVIGTAGIYGRIRFGYETWRKIHYLTYALLPLAFVHSMALGSDLQTGLLRYYWVGLFAVFILVLLHRVWKRISIRRNPYGIDSVSRVNHDVWNLKFSGPEIERKPGQFMILQLGRKGRVSEGHPFTISSGPQDPLAVTVKSVGDFTSTIGDTEVSDTAYIDAPYGVFSFLNFDAGELVFIAGGIGITPFLSMLRYMRDSGSEEKVTLILGNKTQEDIVFGEELEAMSNQLSSLKIVHVLSREQWEGETGFIDQELLKRYIEDFQKPEFFICGPPPMMDMVEEALTGLGVDRDRIHDERFSLR